MPFTIERLRTWIVVLGVLLLLCIAGFLAYAHFRIRRLTHDLPQKLGLEIQQSTNDFTISKSREGHTLFTLHASKAIQYKNSGHLVLHEVNITIYGKDGSRADHISGSQFEYDPSTKIASAQGPVEIELTDPSSLPAGQKANLQKSTGAAGQKSSSAAAAPIRVNTSNLVFNQDSQVASTDQPLTFQKGAASGSARGATYDSGKGELMLAHDVVLRAEIDDDPILMKAAGATFDGNARRLFLIQQQTDYKQRQCSSEQAVIFFGPDGNADHVTAEGHVHLATDDGSDLRASSARAQLDGRGALREVNLDGGLLFVSHDAVRSLHMNSNSGVFSFAPAASRAGKTRPSHLRLIGAVSVVDQQLSPHGSETRESRAGQMDVDLASDSTGHVQAQNVLADGGAVINAHSIRENAPQQITTLKGTQIYATIVDGHELSSLRATGETAIEQSTPGGLDRTSSGDTLLVKFVPGPHGSSPDKTSLAKSAPTDPAAKLATLPKNSAHGPVKLGSVESNQIASAVEQGHAVLTQLRPATVAAAPPVKTMASADRIAYDGVSGKIELTGGSPRVVQADSELTAAVIDFNQGTGDASASGGIKATYSSAAGAATNTAAPAPAKPAQTPPGSQAMHVVADHAALDSARDETTFYGVPHADARLWQGSNSITAPTIVLSRERQLLTATGPASGVKATFVESARSSGSARGSENGNARKAKPSGAASEPPAVFRTSSSSVVYSGGERKVTLSGGVVAQGTTGTIKSSVVELYLNPNSHPSAASAASHGSRMGPDGQVDRLIAENHVQITQGDRTGSGEKLVYTAEDGIFILTGTSAAPPRITDPQHGSVSGSSLTFNNRDDSVVVSHGQSPTVTDTRTNNELRKPSQ